MSKKIMYLLGIATTIIIGTILYYFFCCNCCTKTSAEDCCKADANVKITKAQLPSLDIKGADFDFSCSENIKFLSNSDGLLMPVSDSVTIGFDKLKLDLEAYPSKKIKVTGYATTKEVNSTKFENLAIARANSVKNYLITKGYKEDQILVEGQILDDLTVVGDTLVGPASFLFVDNKVLASNANNEENDALKQKINAAPLVLYFDTNQTDYKLSSKELGQLAEIKSYLEKVKTAKLNIVGHTDAVGTKESNLALGKTRANFVATYLATQGVAESRIITTSKGSEAPVADNATAVGRAKNRRTEITIQ